MMMARPAWSAIRAALYDAILRFAGTAHDAADPKAGQDKQGDDDERDQRATSVIGSFAVHASGRLKSREGEGRRIEVGMGPPSR